MLLVDSAGLDGMPNVNFGLSVAVVVLEPVLMLNFGGSIVVGLDAVPLVEGTENRGTGGFAAGSAALVIDGKLIEDVPWAGP